MRYEGALALRRRLSGAQRAGLGLPSLWESSNFLRSPSSSNLSVAVSFHEGKSPARHSLCHSSSKPTYSLPAPAAVPLPPPSVSLDSVAPTRRRTTPDAPCGAAESAASSAAAAVTACDRISRRSHPLPACYRRFQ